MSADALLAGAHEVDGLQHLVERHAAVLEHGSDLHRELLAAFLLVAFPNAATGTVALELGGRADRAAMRADRVATPQHAFEVLECRVFIVEIALGKNGH